jgi:hypothetical protein
MTRPARHGTMPAMPGNESDAETTTRAVHDLGGGPRFLCDPIDTTAHTLSDFDRQVDALRGLLGAKGVMSVDELRRGIEAIPEPDHHRLSYYERWVRSIAATLLRKGVVTEQELSEAL